MMRKVLRGMEKICRHYGIGKKHFYATVKAGAPIGKDGREWFTHQDELDGWYRTRCRRGGEKEDE